METNLNRCNEDCRGCGDCYVDTCEIHDDGTPAEHVMAYSAKSPALRICAPCARDLVGLIEVAA